MYTLLWYGLCSPAKRSKSSLSERLSGFLSTIDMLNNNPEVMGETGQGDVRTGKEEELVHLLSRIGIKRNVARVLVFLAKTPMATFRAIEQGTDLRHPEVAMVMQFLRKKGWIRSHENNATRKGRPGKNYELSKPITEIVNGIEKEKMKEANDQIQLIQTVRLAGSHLYGYRII
jgi:predicted transcriptional regulator